MLLKRNELTVTQLVLIPTVFSLFVLANIDILVSVDIIFVIAGIVIVIALGAIILCIFAIVNARFLTSDRGGRIGRYVLFF